MKHASVDVAMIILRLLSNVSTARYMDHWHETGSDAIISGIRQAGLLGLGGGTGDGQLVCTEGAPGIE